jgi:hypothetical protein
LKQGAHAAKESIFDLADLVTFTWINLGIFAGKEFVNLIKRAMASRGGAELDPRQKDRIIQEVLDEASKAIKNNIKFHVRRVNDPAELARRGYSAGIRSAEKALKQSDFNREFLPTLWNVIDPEIREIATEVTTRTIYENWDT